MSGRGKEDDADRRGALSSTRPLKPLLHKHPASHMNQGSSYVEEKVKKVNKQT
jgi:hypothetical protein